MRIPLRRFLIVLSSFLACSYDSSQLGAPRAAGANGPVASESGGSDGTGGTTENVAGTTGTGGLLGSGGISTGGVVGTGGSSGSGGSRTGAGGSPAGTGGIPGTGGVVGTGGTVDCGFLKSPANGSVAFASTSLGSSATYVCSGGFNLVGSKVRNCQVDGTWNGSAPTCTPVDCGTLLSPPNGAVSAPITTYGAVATYSCTTGYSLSVISRTCQADGTWSGVAPTCTLVSCGTLTAPTNGSVVAPATSYGSTATYSCTTGYTLSGLPERTCQSGGTWSGSAPTCALVTCGALSAPTNGSVDAPATSYGSTATYSCTTGYTLSGPMRRTCQSGGTWSDSAPTCMLVTCGALSGPTNGSVDVPSTSYGSTATYSCDLGYRPSPAATRTCQTDGTWSGVAPICSLVTCGALTAPTNGLVSAPVRTYGSTATYSCASGYILSGNQTRTCQSSGTWNGSVPTCTLPPYGSTCSTGSDCPNATCCDGSIESCDGTKLPRGDGTNSGQFVVSGNGLTVTDTITGLVWQRDGSGIRPGCSSGGVSVDGGSSSSTLCTWAEAKAYCAGLTLGGLFGWRLPAVMELRTIVDFTVTSGATIDATAFPGTPTGYFRTSSLGGGSSSLAWEVNFFTGSADTWSVGDHDMVRCVR